MSTERDEHGIYHIDGPACAGFIVAEKPDGSGNRVEVRYHNFIYIGTKDECEEAYGSLMNLICSELQELRPQQRDAYPGGLNQLIIWWRRRIEFSEDPDNKDRWKFSCRLATTPPLSPGFWQRWETPEGGLARNAREAIG